MQVETMPDKIHLEVVVPERKVFEAEVDRVEVPGLDGELGILPGHTELISQLKPAGLLTYHIGDEKGEIAISEGFVEISDDRVIILADEAARPEDINLTEALKLKDLTIQSADSYRLNQIKLIGLFFHPGFD